MKVKKNTNETWRSGSVQFFRIMIFISSLSMMPGCNNKISVDLKNTSNKTKNLNVTVTNVQLINRQLVLTGTNLNVVDNFQIKEGSVTTNLQVESKTSTSLVANTLADMTFAAGRIFNFILSSANAASTFQVNFSLCDSFLGGKGFDCNINPTDKQVLSYDANSGKWKPRNVNGLNYMGAWDARTAEPTATVAGEYWIVSVADGGGTYNVGDWIVYNGSTFDQINNSTSITQVFGRTGNVVATKGDYNLNKLADVDLTTTTPTTGNFLKFDGTNWVPGTVVFSGGTVTGVTGTAPIVSSGGNAPAISITKATTTTDGYLSSTDWNSFNGKEPAITAAGTTKYFRGDKTFVTLDTSVVSENTNLYFTNARVLGVPLTGYSVGTSTALVSTDTVLSAFQKVQGQLNAKSDSSSYIDWSTSGVQTIDPSRLTLGAGNASKAVVTGAAGVMTASGTTATELGYVSGVTSAIQTQLNSKQSTIDKTTVLPLSTVRLYGANATNYVELSAPTLTGNITYKFPAADGNSGQVLSTDHSGNLSWVSVGAASIADGSITYAKLNLTDGDIPQAKVNGLSTALSGKEPTITAGSTSQYIRGDKSLSTFASDVLVSLLTGLTTATSSAISATDSVLAAFGKLQAQITTLTSSDSAKLTKNGTDSITGSVSIAVTGDITTSNTPAGLTSLVNKSYVDSAVSNLWTSDGSGNIDRTSGKVGIATSSTPRSALDLATGVLRTNAYLAIGKGSSNNDQITFNLVPDNSGNYTPSWFGDTFGGGAIIGMPSGGEGGISFNTITFGTDGSTRTISQVPERMRITGGGLVGIGTTNPTKNLDVVSSDSNTQVWARNNTSSSTRYPGFVAQNYMGTANTGYPAINVVNSRGTSTVPGPVQSNDILGAIVAGGNYDSSGVYTNYTNAALIEFLATGTYSGTSTPSAIIFLTTAAASVTAVERMRIDEVGNVGIGTSGAVAKLDVNGEIKTGNSGLSCSSTTSGSMRYNSTSSVMEFCDGSSWVTFASSGEPSGTIKSFAGASAPGGYMICNGNAVSRTTYANLFSVIGTTYGAGDGSTTFNLPDFRGRVLIGAGQGAGLTNRAVGDVGGDEKTDVSGVSIKINTNNTAGGTATPSGNYIGKSGGSAGNIFNSASDGTSLASSAVSIGTSGTAGGSAGNMQPFAVVNYIIKY